MDDIENVILSSVEYLKTSRIFSTF